jgi:hypothetical protein
LKIEAIELFVSMDGFVDIRAAVLPLDIVFPWPHSQPYAPNANVRLLTSRGDFRETFNLRNSLQPMQGSISSDEAQKHFEILRRQIERIHV